MEKYLVECECGSSMDLEQYQVHVCVANPIPELASKESCSDDNLMPKLIELIHARQALWDHTLPLKMRAREIKERLWKEIASELNNIMTISDMEKKWKNLRDTFIKNLKTNKLPSGSGADDGKKWKWNDHLSFLAKVNSHKQTISNITIESPLVSPGTSADSEVENPGSSRKKQRKDNAEELLVNILREPAPKFEEPKLSAALLTVQSILEKLPPRVRMRAEIDMINKAYSLYDECAEK